MNEQNKDAAAVAPAVDARNHRIATGAQKSPASEGGEANADIARRCEPSALSSIGDHTNLSNRAAPIYQIRSSVRTPLLWGDVPAAEYERYAVPEYVRRIVHAAPVADSAMAKDAELLT